VLRRIRPHISYANVIATLALVIALGGTSYAAFNLPDNSVKSRNIVDGQVKSQDLAKHAVTRKKVAPATITNADIVPNAITGAAVAQNTLFQCQPGDAALENRNFCAFEIHRGAVYHVDWPTAVQLCRARGSTPARLPTAAELASFAPVSGSAFHGIDVWTADPAVAGVVGSGTPPKMWSMSTDSNGNVATIEERPIDSQVADIVCVYAAADVK
jgi:hypothetical protein